MSHTIDKAAAHKMIDSMPEDASWDDLMHEIYVRMKIERGLADVRAGRLVPHEQVMKEFGLEG